jgi:hypothetical protein
VTSQRWLVSDVVYMVCCLKASMHVVHIILQEVNPTVAWSVSAGESPHGCQCCCIFHQLLLYRNGSWLHQICGEEGPRMQEQTTE